MPSIERPLAGDPLVLRLGEEMTRVSEPDLLALRAGVPHSVASDGGGTFFLTVSLANGGEGS